MRVFYIGQTEDYDGALNAAAIIAHVTEQLQILREDDAAAGIPPQAPPPALEEHRGRRAGRGHDAEEAEERHQRGAEA